MATDKHFEIDVHELNERLAAIVDAADDAIIGETIDGTVTSWNRGAERLYGYTAKEMIGKFMKLLEPPEKVGEVDFILARMKNGETISHFETVRMRKDGTRIQISKSVSPIRNSRGIITGFVNITHDITELRREAELRVELDQRLSAIVDAAEDAIIGKTVNGIVTSWNRGAERLYGYSATEMIGKPMELLEPPEKAGEIETILSRIMRGERVAHFETVRMRKDGTRVSISKSVSPIRNLQGEIIGAVNVTHDITEQKRQAESRLEMEKYSSSRRLSQSLASEINDPLETIKNAIRVLLSRSASDSDERKLLEIAASQTERIINMSRRIT